MAEKEEKKETKQKEPSQAEIRSNVKAELGFFRDVTNYVKQMKDNGCLSINLENDIRDFMDGQVRAIIGLPEKPKPPTYTPPPMPPTQQPPVGSYPQQLRY